MGKNKALRILLFLGISAVLSLYYTNCGGAPQADLFESFDPKCDGAVCVKNDTSNYTGGVYAPAQTIKPLAGVTETVNASMRKLEFTGQCNPNDAAANRIEITIRDPSTGCYQPLYPPSACLDDNCFKKSDYTCESGRYTILVPVYNDYKGTGISARRLVLSATLVGLKKVGTAYQVDSNYEGRFQSMNKSFEIRGIPFSDADRVTVSGGGTYSYIKCN